MVQVVCDYRKCKYVFRYIRNNTKALSIKPFGAFFVLIKNITLHNITHSLHFNHTHNGELAMKTLLALIISISICGCVSNGLTIGLDESTPEQAIAATEKRFIGVPFLLSAEGSVVYLGNNWYITAAHNKLTLEAQMLDVIYHQSCDVALFKSKTSNASKIQLGIIKQGETTHTVGYPLLAPLTGNAGKYTGDLYEPDRKCLYSATSSKVTSGMSGGGVWNDKGELVGIIRGVMMSRVEWPDGRSMESPSIFTSVYGIHDWIYEHTGVAINAN